DFAQMRDWVAKAQTPYTPAVSLMRALREALRIILAEGVPATIERHRQLGAAVRDGVEALGMRLFADPRHYSNSVTAIHAPDGVPPADLRKSMRDEYDVVLAGAPSRLAETVFRIGHLGNISKGDVLATLGALEACLRRFGARPPAGAGVVAAAAVFGAR